MPGSSQLKTTCFGRLSDAAADSALAASAATARLTAHPPVAGEVPAIDVGHVIRNRFELIEEVGAGGMGRVFKALDRLRQEAHDRTPHVAVKVLSPAFREHPSAFVALQRESKRAQELAHPNIVRVYDFDRDGTTVYMTMELLTGGSLDALLRAPGFRGLPLAEVLAIVRPVGEALAFAHASGVVHADLKPSNIFRTDDGRMKVIDFGIARSIRPADSEATVFDAGALRAHTPLYASPELIDGEPADPRDDVFALACIVYQLLTGEHPFGRRSASTARKGGCHPVRPTSLGNRAWAALAAGLAFERDRRLPSSAALLQGLADGAGPPGRPPSAATAVPTVVPTARDPAKRAPDAGRWWRLIAAPSAALVIIAAVATAGLPTDWGRAVDGGSVGDRSAVSYAPEAVPDEQLPGLPAPAAAADAQAGGLVTPLFDAGRFGVAVGRSPALPEWAEQALFADPMLLRGIEVRPLPAEGAESAETARRAVLQSGADLRVWSAEGADSRLRLTVSPRLEQNGYLPRETDVVLPRLPAEDAASVLRLILLTHFAVHEAQQGRGEAAQAGPLPWAIDAVRRMLTQREGARRWSEEAKAAVRTALADALTVAGGYGGRIETLAEAIQLYQEALRLPRERDRDAWAVRQNNLGHALAARGELADDVPALAASADAFRQALLERSREGAPLDWASSQHGLGIALTARGERAGGTQQLLAAVEAYRVALAVRTRERLPLDWAATMNDLGTALSALGERERSTPRLEEAIAVLRAALAERGKETAPLDWAATQNNLALALGALGALEGGTGRLEEAVATYDRAMQVFNREAHPARWAALQNNLGTALEMLGNRRRDARLIERSCAAFSAAAQVFGEQGAAADAQGATRNLERCRNRRATYASR